MQCTINRCHGNRKYAIFDILKPFWSETFTKTSC